MNFVRTIKYATLADRASRTFDVHVVDVEGGNPAFWIEISARQDGPFTVTNAGNGLSKTYAAR